MAPAQRRRRPGSPSVSRRQSKSTPKLGSLRDLFIDELKDLYNAEQQITKALPKMARAVRSEELKHVLQRHLEETRGQVQRLERIFQKLDTTGKGKKCKGMEGLLEEGAEMMQENAAPNVKDAGLIGAAQRVEHYEMAGYGCVCAYAELLGEKEAVRLLQQTFDEEAKADMKLTELSERINEAANGNVEE